METDKLKELVKPYEAAAIRMGFVVFKAEGPDPHFSNHLEG